MAINDLDQAVLASMSDNLKPSTNDSIKVMVDSPKGFKKNGKNEI